MSRDLKSRLRSRWTSATRNFKFDDARRGRFVALGFALVLLSGAFADVIFFHASFSMVDVYESVVQNPRLTSLLRNVPPKREVWHGFYDTGGAVFQSEPGIQFLSNSIRNGESPFWNPYSAAGSLGPETLVDIKFSPISVLTAIAGGSSRAFHITYLIAYLAAVYFFFRTLTLYFGLSTFASASASIVYLLNGFNVANLSSNVSQSYLFFPICLFCLVAFAVRPSVNRYIFVVASNILILATTFFPTTILVIGSAFFISAAFTFSLHNNSRSVAISDVAESSGYNYKVAATVCLINGSSFVVSFLLLAVLYFPIFESMKLLGTLSSYGERIFYPASFTNLLSLFTPKHFWESYNAMNPDAAPFIGNAVFHIGIAAALIASFANPAASERSKVLVIALWIGLVLSIGRIFGIPVISQFFDLLPVIRNIGEQYVWVVVAALVPILCGFGFDSMAKSRANKILPALLVALIAGCVFQLYLAYGFPASHDVGNYLNTKTAKIYIVIAVLFLTATIALALRIGQKQTRARAPLAKAMLCLLVFAELVFYMNHTRPARSSIFDVPPDYVTYIKEHIGNDRVVSYEPFSMHAEFGAAFQIQQLESMNMNILPAYSKLFTRYFIPAPNEGWGDFATLSHRTDKVFIDEQILNLFSVKYILVPNHWVNHQSFFKGKKYPIAFESKRVTVFENVNRYPRIFAVPTLIKSDAVPDSEHLSGREAAFTEDAELLAIARREGVPDAADRASGRDFEHVNVLEYRNARVVAAADLARPSVVVLMDNWHPNWKAYVDGSESYIGKVNQSFRGLVLPAGKHRIEMIYRPASLTAALFITFLTFLILITLFIARRRLDSTLQALEPQALPA